MGSKVTFDPITKIIQVDEAPDGDGYVDLDVKIDLYSDGKEDWVTDSDLQKLPLCMRAVGGDPLPGSKFLGSTFFLDSGWKIRPYEQTHICRVEGNLYAEDGSSPFVPTTGSYNVMITSTVSSIVTTALADSTEIISSLEQLRDGNVSYEFVKATIIDAGRNVAIDTLDSIIVKYKATADSDWSSPLLTQTLYMWYETLGDVNPIRIGENDN